MATPQQTQEMVGEDMLDLDNNPFIDWTTREYSRQPSQWHDDEEASKRVLDKIRWKINFYEMALKECEENPIYDQELVEHVQRKLFVWRLRLSKAQYN